MISTVRVKNLGESLSIAWGASNVYTAWITTIDIEYQKDCYSIKYAFNEKNIPHFHRFFRDYGDDEISVEDITLIIDFLRTLRDDEQEHSLGINCAGGTSRSAAVGMIAWMIQGDTAEIALEKILKVQRQAKPNTRILELYDEIAGNSSLQTVQDWCRSCTKCQ